MAKEAGRLCVIKKNGTTISGGRNVGITVNGTPINISDQNDGGLAKYLGGVMTGKSLELTLEGYEEDNILRDISLGPDADKFMTDLSFEFPDGDTVTGDFVLMSYSETGPYEDGQTFSASFSSDGAWTHTKV